MYQGDLSGPDTDADGNPMVEVEYDKASGTWLPGERVVIEDN